MLPAAYAIFLANFVFGILVKSRVIDTRRFRGVHHVLYFFVVASLLAAAVVAFIGGTRSAWALAGMTGLLLLMPKFRGRSRGHWMYAAFCSVVYSAIVFWH